MDKIVQHLNKNGIPFIIEVNEIDFQKRPNTKRSIKYLLRT